MKSLKCDDIGGVNCGFEATGETSDEVKGKMMEHAKEVHPEKLEGMTDESKAEMDKLMDEKMTDVAK